MCLELSASRVEQSAQLETTEAVGNIGQRKWRRRCSFAAHRLASPIAEVRDAERRMARAYVMFDNLGLCL